MTFLLMSFGAGVREPACTHACGGGEAGLPTLVLVAALLLAWPMMLRLGVKAGRAIKALAAMPRTGRMRRRARSAAR